ncbi:MFS transporter [archaeon]|nr:MFS transporter [archaeon]
MISTFSEGIILPIYAIFVQKIGGDILDAGLALGIFLMFEGIFTYFIHTKKRNHDKKIKIMISGWFVWLIGILIYLVISSKWTLFLAQIFLALGNALADPIYDEEFASNTNKNSSEKQWGLFEGGISFTQGLSAMVGGIIASIFGFEILIYTMAITATISFILILYYFRRVRK